jgi:hypothetical protein
MPLAVFCAACRETSKFAGTGRKKRPARVNRFTRLIRGKRYRHRCHRKEQLMSDLAARSTYSPLLSTPFKIVCLFCLLGLLLATVIMLITAPEHLTWVLSHTE